jgi:glutathione peroxidase
LPRYFSPRQTLGLPHRGDRNLDDAGSVSVSGVTLKDIALTTLDGKPTTLAELSNGATLVVNVASKCGLTPQYTALEKLARDYGARGLTVVGVPCNQFMGQEPGTADEIQEFCSTTYGVTFPLLAKIDVNGDDRHPLYAELTKAVDSNGSAGDVQWNFEKFLVAPDGEVVNRFRPRTEPDAPEVVGAIEAVLANRRRRPTLRAARCSDDERPRGRRLGGVGRAYQLRPQSRHGYQAGRRRCRTIEPDGDVDASYRGGLKSHFWVGVAGFEPTASSSSGQASRPSGRLTSLTLTGASAVSPPHAAIAAQRGSEAKALPASSSRSRNAFSSANLSSRLWMSSRSL